MQELVVDTVLVRQFVCLKVLNLSNLTTCWWVVTCYCSHGKDLLFARFGRTPGCGSEPA